MPGEGDQSQYTRTELVWGDNKLVMASLLKGDPASGIESLAGTIDLIYIDPPFDIGAGFSFRSHGPPRHGRRRASSARSTR